MTSKASSASRWHRARDPNSYAKDSASPENNDPSDEVESGHRKTNFSVVAETIAGKLTALNTCGRAQEDPLGRGQMRKLREVLKQISVHSTVAPRSS